MITSDISPCEDERWSREYARGFEKFTGYKTIMAVNSKEDVEERLKTMEYITFLSSSAVESFVKSLKYDISCVKSLKVISIGPSTTKTLKNFKINIFAEAKEYTADGIMKILEKE